MSSRLSHIYSQKEVKWNVLFISVIPLIYLKKPSYLKFRFLQNNIVIVVYSYTVEN